MASDKIDASAVYVLFEELKQKIVEQGKNAAQPVHTESMVNSAEITTLIEELQKVINQKQFTPDQIEELRENMAEFTGCALGKSFEKLDGDFEKITDLINQLNKKIEPLNVPQNFVIRREHAFSLDFKNSKATITMIAMSLVILLSLAGNVWQTTRNSQLKDNDLKYRYINMQGEANPENLLRLETVFTYDRNKDSIAVIRERVETYERLVKEQAEKIERERLNTKEAERLEREVENIKR
ncbi:hypothetical protein [Bacteroides sp. UBA939]|uniref:hypothetical protein n=1 Tax=Bacteroides sp. UBA939 TaxID=1946092 RepID=UPI0025B978CB|nr:hypothetical protein [Bacteroides sp. UBA939]